MPDQYDSQYLGGYRDWEYQPIYEGSVMQCGNGQCQVDLHLSMFEYIILEQKTKRNGSRFLIGLHPAPC